MNSKYYKAVLGDIILKADTLEDANRQLDEKIKAGKIPVLSVEEYSLTDEEAREYLEDQGDCLKPQSNFTLGYKPDSDEVGVKSRDSSLSLISKLQRDAKRILEADE